MIHSHITQTAAAGRSNCSKTQIKPRQTTISALTAVCSGFWLDFIVTAILTLLYHYDRAKLNLRNVVTRQYRHLKVQLRIK